MWQEISGLCKLRDGPLENLSWGGGGAKYKKKFAQGKIKWKKILARQLILKKYSCYGLKIHTRNLITKKNSCGSKIPLPSPITFLIMVRPLVEQFSKRKNYCKNSLPRCTMFTSQNKLWKFMCRFSKWNVLQLKRSCYKVETLVWVSSIDSNVDLFKYLYIEGI